jgi:DNA polymerase-1
VITAIFDMHNLIHRNYSVLTHYNGATTPEAVFASVGGTINRVLKSLGDETSPLRTPGHTIRWLGAWDGGKDTWRHRTFPGYKRDRPPHPDGFDSLVARCRALFSDGGRVPQFRVLGWEADDVIATLVRLAAKQDPEGPIVVVSNDRDLLMLVRDDAPPIVVCDPAQQHSTRDKGLKPTSWWTADRVRADFGVGPAALVDLKALQGDESDGIPGVPGFGTQRARRLIGNFGSLETGWEKGQRRTTDREENRVAALLTPENFIKALKWREFIRLCDDVPGLDYAFATVTA